MAALAGALLLLAASSRSEYVRVTYYTLPGVMANGERVGLGAAACSRWMPLGTRLELPDGWVVTCKDRGLGDYYWKGWVDVWAPSREWGRAYVTGAYGDYAWVNLLEDGDD
jgi:hypothetical protein